MYSALLLNLFIMGVLGLDQDAVQKGFSLCSAYGYTLLQAKFGKEEHLLCLKMQPLRKSHLTSKRSVLLLDPDQDVHKHGLQPFPLGEVTLAYGFPVLDPNIGSAEGYIGEDHHFYGVLHLGSRTLHADPYGTDDPERSFGAFEYDNVVAPLRPRRDHAQVNGCEYFGDVVLPFELYQRRRPPGTARSRVCDLLLLADKEFFEKDANASLHHVVRRMMHAVAQADIVFRNADFNEDGVPDNIGFSVKYILVLTSNETNVRVFGDMLSAEPIDGRNYLMRFARLRRLSEVCLGVAFSGHAFHNRTLGLSFTSLGGGLGRSAGGLCDRRAYGYSFNTLVVAHATGGDEARVPERIAALTLAHELGHSFGAHHDDHFPNPECRGFLMGSESSQSNSATSFEFSLCSKRLIASTLNSMSYCLKEEDRPFCGNGIVEAGEACDCGMPSRCADRDPCCTPRAGGALIYDEGTLHKAGCAVAPTAMCHPSQGPCCNSKCKHTDLTGSGIECSSMDQQCTCFRPDCRCGLGGRCFPDGSCHSVECAALGLRECQCEPKGMGGRLTEAAKCGVCCKVATAGGTHCVAAETASHYVAFNVTVPPQWLDHDYRGPNVTIQMCSDCANTMIRAWSVNDWCVTMNTVGVCTIQGVCRAGRRVPRSNIYPDIMHVKLVAAHEVTPLPATTTSKAARYTPVWIPALTLLVI